MTTLHRTLPLLVAFASGCVIVPATHTTVHPAGTVEGELVKGPDRGLEMIGTTIDDKIAVRATRIRECRRQILAVSEVTKSKHMRLGGADDPRAQVFGLLLAPITIPVSFLITGLDVAGSHDETTRQTRVIREIPQECRELADVPVEIALPSGATLHGKTDASGLFAIRIPETEPYEGVAIARSEAEKREIAYARPKAPVTAVRDAVRDCAGRLQVTGDIQLRLTIDDNGMPLRVRLGTENAPLASCVATGIAKVRFPAGQRGTTLVFPLAAPRA